MGGSFVTYSTTPTWCPANFVPQEPHELNFQHSTIWGQSLLILLSQFMQFFTGGSVSVLFVKTSVSLTPSFSLKCFLIQFCPFSNPPMQVSSLVLHLSFTFKLPSGKVFFIATPNLQFPDWRRQSISFRSVPYEVLAYIYQDHLNTTL